MRKKSVLAIDDEQHILELLKYNLEANGYEVHTATSVYIGLEILKSVKIDVVLLDMMLPDVDGLSALKDIKSSEYKDIPVIMVTAKTDEIDKIIGLELGADDYICKPFSVRELIARVKVVSRRYKGDNGEETKNELTCKNLKMDLLSHRVTFEGDKIDLTLKEFELLRLLMENRGRAFTREALLDRVWGYDYTGETRTVDVHIRYLRGKMEPYNIDTWIETVRGVGYRFIKE
ncbi:MAG: DNA-binding response regulator [Epulopiscium sp. Nele67-Bin005]|nr:MAG: DNA-binding response regulator [Epulopiscium sp. Nele67-Bin005]